MAISRTLAFLLAALALPCLAGDAPKLDLQDVNPEISKSPLINPGMGLYLFGTLNPAEFSPQHWCWDALNIGYFRSDWSVLEPDKEGEYRFDEYFNPIFELWVKQWNKRVAFRFMSQNMHSRQKYVTPKWVFDAGVPGFPHKGIYTPEQIDPSFWDEKYLAIQERFIADLGKYLDGRPGLEFIDIGSIGQWGEMHLQLWTPEQLEASGYTDTKYIAAYRRIIDAFARAFPRTRVFLNIGHFACINDYAAMRGIHFRQDGLSPTGPSANVGELFYKPYARKRVICNYELCDDYYSMQKKHWGLAETFNRGLEDPISYLHINLMNIKQLQDAPPDVKPVVLDAARRIGFRFELTHLRCNRTLHVRPEDKDHFARLLIEHTWRNAGAAPCYDSYALAWSLRDSQGAVVAEQLDFPRVPTTEWWPVSGKGAGEALTQHSMMRVNAALPPGKYRLCLSMLKPESPAAKIQLAIAGGGADGSYDLCEISAEPAPAVASALTAENFIDKTAWIPAAGIALNADKDGHDGHPALALSGEEHGKSWSFASTKMQPLLPGSQYRFSAWMKVEKLTPVAHAPYMKLALHDGDGKWLMNCNTTYYDMTQSGAWQRLSATIETPADTAQFQFAVEKGVMQADEEATLRISDLSLELTEAP